VQAEYISNESIDELIEKAKSDMERAAKSLDFLAAARYRDRMYELQKLKERES
jgi:excinuclease ABC subunit B